MIDKETLEAFAELAAKSKGGSKLKLAGGREGLLIPEGMQLVELEKYQAKPTRKRVSVTMDEVTSFIAYINEQRTADTRIFGVLVPKTGGGKFEAVIDFHGAGPEDQTWTEHRVTLNLGFSPEWEHWSGSNCKFIEQEEFALMIEAHLPDIVSPDGATMLEIAASLQATLGVDFRSAVRLEDGTKKLMCDEEMAAKAGVSGQLEIPPKFSLDIPVFQGGEIEHIDARFRYSIAGGGLRLAYMLIRPELLLDAAVRTASKQIQDQTERPVFMGSLQA